MATVRWSFLHSSSPEFAWWFGVFLGDGCAPADRSGLQCTGSHSTARRWRALLTDSDKGLRETKHSLGTFVVTVSSVALNDWMFQVHGYRGKKSHSLRWPEWVLPEHKVHFLRGLWDTDGCLSIAERKKHGWTGNPSPFAAYRSATRAMVERVRDELVALVDVPAAAVTSSENGTFLVSWGGSNGMKVADFLYGDAPEHLRNEDRIEVYRAMCALRDRLAEACACGEPEQYSEGLCRACWQSKQPRTTGPGTQCATEGCLRPVWTNGLCNACRKRQARAEGRYMRELKGTCPCGSPSYRADGLCVACFARRRRGAPTRFEVPRPAKGWPSRTGAKLPGRPRTSGTET